MGYGVLNIWVRERDCSVAKMDGYAWAKCCCNQSIVAQGQLKKGHAELRVPPGTYIVDASWRPGCCGEAKETIVIVGCGQTVCVNLIREWAGDPIPRIIAFSAHAKEAGLPRAKVNEMVKNISAIAKTVPKDKIRFYTTEELRLKRKVSDKAHQAILTKYRKLLTGK